MSAVERVQRRHLIAECFGGRGRDARRLVAVGDGAQRTTWMRASRAVRPPSYSTLALGDLPRPWIQAAAPAQSHAFAGLYPGRALTAVIGVALAATAAAARIRRQGLRLAPWRFGGRVARWGAGRDR
jgi:hypothetical protein